MARKGENIRKRADGRWEGRYIVIKDGIPKVKSVYAHSYKEVKQKLAKQKSMITEIKAEDKMAVIMLEDIAQEWLVYLESKINVKLKHSTYTKYAYIYSHYIKESLGACSLKNLTDEYVEQHLNLSLSQSTLRSIYVVLNQILAYASMIYQIPKCSLTRSTSKTGKNAIDILNISEQTRLIQCLLYDTDIYKLGVYISLFTGLRLGEVCALQWEDIDMNLKLLHVNHTVQRVAVSDQKNKTILIETSPKSFCSKREIPISEPLYLLLKEFYCGSKYLLKGNKPMEPRTMQNKFKKYLKVAGVRETNFHTLRHTFATNCIQMGADVKSVSEVLGHSNVKTTLNRYVHPSMETKRNYMNQLAEISGQKMGQ